MTQGQMTEFANALANNFPELTPEFMDDRVYVYPPDKTSLSGTMLRSICQLIGYMKLSFWVDVTIAKGIYMVIF